MRIAVCDDEENYLIQLRDLIDHICKSMDIIVDIFTDGRKLLERFDSNPYDILFLDIEMPSMDGITLAKKIRERSENVFIIFLTGHVEFALEGYEVNALRYLTKPIREDKLRESLKYIMDKQSSHHQLIVRMEGEELCLNVTDIRYLEAQNQYVMIHTNTNKYLIRGNMNDFEENLKPDGFFRIHRSYLISLSKIVRLQRNDVLLEGNISLPVSRNNMKLLKEALYSYVDSEAF